MRDRLLKCLCSALVLWASSSLGQGAPPPMPGGGPGAGGPPPPGPGAARAVTPAATILQAGDSDDGDDAQPANQPETEGQAVEQRQDGKVRMKEGASEEAPGEVHTVVKGDTLWDLSQKYLGSPWYWPKVWSYNPQIANPHWIYPGNQIRFSTEGEEVPTRVDVASKENGEGNGNGPTPAEELPQTGEDVLPTSELSGEDNTVHVSGKIGYTPRAGIHYTQTGFATREEVEASGVITGSFSDALMLSAPDLAYVTFRRRADVKVGDKYLVFRQERRIDHPITHQTVGYLTRLLGVVKVEGVPETKMVRTRVLETWAEIQRGDMIGPYGEQVHAQIVQKPADRDLNGYVVSALIDNMAIIGERALVVVDKGRQEGVQQGNTFTIVRQGDPSRTLLNPAKPNPDMPLEDIGSCVALDVKAHATTCMLVRSLRDIVPGDRVVMRSSDVKVGALTR